MERDYVEFDNISYAIDTPKINDTVIFDTLTERCVNAEIIDNNTLSNIEAIISEYKHDELKEVTFLRLF